MCKFFLFLYILSLSPLVHAQTKLELFRKGVELTEAQKYEEANTYFKKVLELDPRHLPALQGLGTNYLFLKNYQAGEKALREASRIDPQNVSTLMTLGKLYETQDVYYKAHFYYEKVLKLDPYQTEAHWGKGRVFNKDRQYRNAIEAFGKVLDLDPYHKGGLQGMAFAHRRLGNYEKAVAYEKKILELYPEDIEAIIRMANHYESMGDTKNAIFWYEKARLVNPKDEKIHVKLAILYGKADQIDAAATSLQQAIALQEGNIENYITLGRVYGWLARLDEAIAIFEKAARLDPTNVRVMNDLAASYLLNDQWDRAEEMFERVLKIDPKDKTALKGLEQIEVEKRPLFTSRFHYFLEKDKDPTNDREGRRQEYAQEALYKFSPSFSLEGRYQRNERHQDIIAGDREYKFKQDIASLKIRKQFGTDFIFSLRGEYNHFEDGQKQIYNFKKRFDRFSSYTYALWQPDSLFGFVAYNRGLVLRRMTTGTLQMNPYHSPILSFGYNITPRLLTVLRYSYFDFKELHDRHDLETTTTWRLPFWEEVEIGYAFQLLSDPQTGIHTLSFEFQERLFKKMLFDFIYKFDFDNNKTDRGTTYVHHPRLILSVPLYQKLMLNVDVAWDIERGPDRDLDRTYRLYLEIPTGMFF